MNRQEAKQLADKHSFKEVETTGRYLIPRRVVHIIIDSLNEDFEQLQKENTRLKKHIIKKRCCQDCKNYLSGFQSDGLLWENCEFNYQCSNIFDNHFEEIEKGCFDVN